MTAPGAGIPEDVYRFLYQNIESVEQLELLMLLFQAPERGWSPAAGAGAVAGDRAECYQYAPRTPELHTTVARLAGTYRERRVAVITLIASKPLESVRAFSDAFRIRKKED